MTPRRLALATRSHDFRLSSVASAPIVCAQGPQLAYEGSTVAESDEDALTGLGIGLGLALFGVLCISFLPDYLGTETPGWRNFWSVLGGLFGLVGLGGALLELEKVFGIKGWSELGVVVVLGGLAGILHVVQTAVGGVWGTGLRTVVALLVLIALVGGGVGAGKLVASRTPRARREVRESHRGAAVLSVATALIGLATALVNFFGAG